MCWIGVVVCVCCRRQGELNRASVGAVAAVFVAVPTAVEGVDAAAPAAAAAGTEPPVVCLSARHFGFVAGSTLKSWQSSNTVCLLSASSRCGAVCSPCPTNSRWFSRQNWSRARTARSTLSRRSSVAFARSMPLRWSIGKQKKQRIRCGGHDDDALRVWQYFLKLSVSVVPCAMRESVAMRWSMQNESAHSGDSVAPSNTVQNRDGHLSFSPRQFPFLKRQSTPQKRRVFFFSPNGRLTSSISKCAPQRTSR